MCTVRVFNSISRASAYQYRTYDARPPPEHEVVNVPLDAAVKAAVNLQNKFNDSALPSGMDFNSPEQTSGINARAAEVCKGRGWECLRR